MIRLAQILQESKSKSTRREYQLRDIGGALKKSNYSVKATNTAEDLQTLCSAFIKEVDRTLEGKK